MDWKHRPTKSHSRCCQFENVSRSLAYFIQLWRNPRAASSIYTSITQKSRILLPLCNFCTDLARVFELGPAIGGTRAQLERNGERETGLPAPDWPRFARAAEPRWADELRDAGFSIGTNASKLKVLL